MTFWLILGGMVLAGWALLTVLAGELNRRTIEMRSQARQRRLAAHSTMEPLRVK